GEHKGGTTRNTGDRHDNTLFVPEKVADRNFMNKSKSGPEPANPLQKDPFSVFRRTWAHELRRAGMKFRVTGTQGSDAGTGDRGNRTPDRVIPTEGRGKARKMV